MPDPKTWPNQTWFTYHVGRKEWKKATQDLTGMLDNGLITTEEFDEQWQILGTAILAGRKL